MGGVPLQRILLADDEPDILEIARIALSTLGGYEVAACDSGLGFLNLLPEFKPDLVLVDVLMPDVGGVDLVQRMRTLPGGDGVPVVFLTGLVLDHELRKLREAGAIDIITKPFDPMTLAERIAGIWEGQHGC